MSEWTPVALRDMVRQRANHCCEYCLLPEEDTFFPHEVDHVLARKHRGLTQENNLALARFVCNRLKGSDLETGKIVELFHPRNHRWAEHFRLEGARIIPLTPVGRVTEHLLQLNRPDRLRRRQLLLEIGRYPRPDHPH